MKINKLEYESLNSLILQESSDISLSELHGMMLGYLTTDESPCYMHWVDLIENDLIISELTNELQDALKSLFYLAQSQLLLSAEDMFLALPNQNRQLICCLSSFADWSRGYLYGVGLSNHPLNLVSDTEVRELLSDITQFSQVALDEKFDESNVQENVELLTSVINHLKVAVNAIFECSIRYRLSPNQIKDESIIYN